MDKKYIILTCDGGSIRGLASAVVLAELETRLNQKRKERGLPPREFYKDFNLLAGTSAGSINVCGISSGISPSKVRNLFIDEGINIFPEALTNLKLWLRRVRLGYSHPIFTDDFGDGRRGINNVLQNVGDGVLNKSFDETMVKPTLVASYDMRNQQFIVFNNTVEAHKDIKTWEVIRSSSAAPVALPAYLLSNSQFITAHKQQGYKVINDKGTECIPLVDGGLAANNPAMYAITYALSQGVKLENIVVASVGTGLNPPPGQDDKKTALQLTRKDAIGWGIFEWISPLREVPILRSLFDGSADATDFQVRQLLKLGENYFRFQPKFKTNFQSFNANPDVLRNDEQNGMMNQTQEFLRNGVVFLDENQTKRISVSALMDTLVELILQEKG